jgi:hypothetical protein
MRRMTANEKGGNNDVSLAEMADLRAERLEFQAVEYHHAFRFPVRADARTLVSEREK